MIFHMKSVIDAQAILRLAMPSQPRLNNCSTGKLSMILLVPAKTLGAGKARTQMATTR